MKRFQVKVCGNKFPENFRELTLVNKKVIEKMSNEVTEGINKVINSIV